MSGVAGAHLESGLETEIAEHLAANGWLYSPTDAGYDRELALFSEDVLGWLEDSQPAEYETVVRPTDTDAQRDAAAQSILTRLAKSLDLDPLKNGGTIRILHEGFSMVPLHGGAVRFRVAQFRPATTQNPDTLAAYAKMRVRVMRQVHYSVKHPNKALDLALFVNGIPVATVELKTDFTQPIENAVDQYRFDRSPAGERLFGFAKRSLVHFVVSNSEVRMTTRLAGAATRFLPFNKGADEGRGTPSTRTDRPHRTSGKRYSSATPGCNCWGRSCTCRSKPMSTRTQARRQERRRCCSPLSPVARRDPAG
ncbi:type I restriction endonuclease [Curtobacterium flaccumfaciens]|nr:type I restriction endonuclease [Curtobacterium flaccumfaciens]